MVKDNHHSDPTLLGDYSNRSTEHMKKKYASLVVVEGQEIGKEYRLRDAQNIIGRDTSANIAITGDPKISRHHTRIQVGVNPAQQDVERIARVVGGPPHPSHQLEPRGIRGRDQPRVQRPPVDAQSRQEDGQGEQPVAGERGSHGRGLSGLGLWR